jgi:TonB family protein
VLETLKSRDLAWSAGLHGLAFLALWLGLSWRALAPVAADLDLSLAAFQAAAPNAGGGRAAPKQAWTVPSTGQAPAPAAQALPEPAPLPEAEEGAGDKPCAAPCLENGGGGGTGEGKGAYIRASEASRKPRWISNFIEPEDYPRLAREAGKDGRVVLSVLIDAAGKVRDARLLQGAYEALNEVALRKVRQAVFSPAFDKDGNPASCLVTLPIRFELR